MSKGLGNVSKGLVALGAGAGVLVAFGALPALGTSPGAPSLVQPTKATALGSVQTSPPRASARVADATKGSSVKQTNEGAGADTSAARKRPVTRVQAQTEGRGDRNSRSVAGKKAASADGPVSSTPSQQSVKDVTAYWTPDRMADAQPMLPQAPGGRGAGATTPAPPGSTSPGATPSGADPSDP